MVGMFNDWPEGGGSACVVDDIRYLQCCHVRGFRLNLATLKTISRVEMYWLRVFSNSCG